MQRTREAARGRWRAILRTFGFTDQQLNPRRHCPCPICGGKDRYRYSDYEQNGNWICTHCGAGDGFQLLMKANGWDWSRTVEEVDKLVGEVPMDKPTPKTKDPREEMRKIWRISRPITQGDPVWWYLKQRGIHLVEPPWCLRYVPSLPYFGTDRVKTYDACVSCIQPVDGGKGVNMQRIYLERGQHPPYMQKASVEAPKRLMPGELPAGSAVRLYPPDGHVLGVAEGIETALSCRQLFGVPTWAAISAHGLQTFEPPEEIEKLHVFADNDHNYVGQAAAYKLASHMVLRRKIEVHVHIPEVAGTDWNDAVLDRVRLALHPG